MPFFESYYQKKIKSVTLQVRILLMRKQMIQKRVLLSTFPTLKGSMTVEASLVLPLFLFASVIMMMPFSIMNHERQVQGVIEAVAEDICQLAYEKDILGSSQLVQQIVWTVYAEQQVRQKLNKVNIQNISLRGSRLLEDGETVHLIMEYQVKLPFPVLRMEHVSRINGSYKRAWVGKEGGYLNGTNLEDDDETVYVGKNSTRYHQSRTCHYLDNQMKKVNLEEISQYQNSNGSKYRPCARCGYGSSGGVYIMPSGGSYHSTMSCTAIMAYVKAVKKSQVEHLGACSYCSGG